MIGFGSGGGRPPRRCAPSRAWGAAAAAVFFVWHGLGVGAADLRPKMLLLDGAVTDGAIVAVGERGTIIRSSDNGQTWQTTRRATTATLTGVSFARDPSGRPLAQGWSVGHDAVILTTADAGRSWTKQFQGENLQESFLDLLAVDAHTVIAVGAYGLCLETKDGGARWTRQRIIEQDHHLNRITAGPTGTRYIAGERGTLLRGNETDANWAAVATPYEGSFYGVLPLDRRTLLAYGLRGHVFRSIDDGASWVPVNTAKPALIATALKLGSNYIVLGGAAGTLLISRDYGKSFTPLGDFPAKGIARLVELPNGDVLVLGELGATVIARPQ